MLACRQEFRRAIEKSAIAYDRQARCVRQRRLRTERRRPRVTQRARSQRIEEPARRQRRKLRGRPVSEDRHIPGGDRVAGKDVTNGRQQSPLQLSALLIEPTANALANLLSPLRPICPLPDLNSPCHGGHHFQQRFKRHPRITHQPERWIRGADLQRVGVGLDNVALEMQCVLGGRFGPKLRPDTQHDIGMLE